MQKKVNLSTFVITIIAAVLATFIITFSGTQIANSLADVINIYKGIDSVGGEIDALQESLPEDKRNPELFKTLAVVDYLYQNGYIGDVDNEDLTYFLVNAYIAYVGDKYGVYYTPEQVDSLFGGLNGELSGLGVYIKTTLERDGVKVFAVMDDAPAKDAGIKSGDIIVEIDGTLVKDIGYEKAADMLVGEVGTSVDLKVLRGDETLEITVIRRRFEAQSVFYHKYAPDNTVGVVRIIEFNQNTPAQFENAVNALLGDGCTSLVFDMRGNGGGTLDSCLEMLDFLLPYGVLAYITDADGNVVETHYSRDGGIDVPMAILVDGGTASAGELFTCALMDRANATVVGTKTYGKGCMQNVTTLPTGGALKYTTNLYNGPTTPNFDGVGITPEVYIELSEEIAGKNLFEISDEADNQLKSAYEALKNNK
ncbi:MAG: PDZ domain-containing protein [Clostridia bacterium]|nr:PDZ domain-containing protein [Clostridia bacterium]